MKKGYYRPSSLVMHTPRYRIAVLLACYNRKEQTLRFLRTLIAQKTFDQHNIDMYLLDDASTDGTVECILAEYPFVHIVQGTGTLFWAGSMRKVWTHAMAQQHYDLFLLFNDDVLLFEGALERLLHHYTQVGRECILIGSTKNPATGAISYGGIDYQVHWIKRSREQLITPMEHQLLPCSFGNANIMLVDAATVQKTGILPAGYTHYFADFDYVHTAYKKGIRVYIAPGYYGYCTDDHGTSWLPQQASLRQRIAYLFNPKGLAYHEQLRFIKKHFPLSRLSIAVKLWMKTLFPVIWDRYKKTNH